MAKKKTENIKAAPVLRAQGGNGGGGQPTPTPEQTGTRTYQIMDPWKDRGVVNLVDIKAVDGEITEVKVNGEPAGGGGGSQATITLTNNTSGKGVTVYGPVLINNVNTYDDSQDPSIRVGMGATVTLTVLLGPSGANLFMGGITSENDMVMTGAISYDFHLHGFVVTGNGTITI